MHSIELLHSTGDMLSDVIGLDSFDKFIMSTPNAMSEYIKGYVNAVSDVSDLPDNLNDGNSSGLSITLSDAQQAQIRNAIQVSNSLNL